METIATTGKFSDMDVGPIALRPLMAGHLWDGIVCANDLIVAQLLRSLKRNHVRVPHVVRLAGFDDAKNATLLNVPLIPAAWLRLAEDLRDA